MFDDTETRPSGEPPMWKILRDIFLFISILTICTACVILYLKGLKQGEMNAQTYSGNNPGIVVPIHGKTSIPND